MAFNRADPKFSSTYTAKSIKPSLNGHLLYAGIGINLYLCPNWMGNMAGTNLLTLIDDIATLLDDVAVLSKVAAKKTTGVLGDDLALNAEQVSGVRAERELPVVWAVAKGSLKNKFILVPAALIISAFVPWLIPILLIIGGLYLCFEGVEKLADKYLHPKDESAHQEQLQAIADPNMDMVQLEQQKIKGAIRTDFILSAEILVIVLGTVQDSSFSMQVSVLSFLALAITVGVYGIVAAIVKIDDAGLYLLNSADSATSPKALLGKGLLRFAPILMKLLSIVGTLAMFLVGGGILVHNIPMIHHLILTLLGSNQGTVHLIFSIGAEGMVGIIAGIICLSIVMFYQKVTGQP